MNKALTDLRAAALTYVGTAAEGKEIKAAATLATNEASNTLALAASEAKRGGTTAKDAIKAIDVEGVGSEATMGRWMRAGDILRKRGDVRNEKDQPVYGLAIMQTIGRIRTTGAANAIDDAITLASTAQAAYDAVVAMAQAEPKAKKAIAQTLTDIRAVYRAVVEDGEIPDSDALANLMRVTEFISRISDHLTDATVEVEEEALVSA